MFRDYFLRHAVIPAQVPGAKDEIASSLAPKGQTPRNDRKRSPVSLRVIRRIARQSQPSLLDFSTGAKLGSHVALCFYQNVTYSNCDYS